MKKEGNEKITLADIAQNLGVSKSTVSRAISGKGRISDSTTQRVKEYIAAHNYEPNAIARGLAQQKTFNICAVTPANYEMVDWDFFYSCLWGIQETAELAGYDILMTSCGDSDISSLERIINNQKVDGVILLRTFMRDAQVDFLRERSLPFVTIGSTGYDDVIQVDHDHRNACRELTSLLLMMGMKKIALVGEDENYVVTQNRKAGFLDAYEALSMKPASELIFLNPENRVRMEKTVSRILEQNADCILCMDDADTMRVLHVLAERKIRVPEEIKVASFYDNTILDNYVPPITALVFDAREIGMEATKILLNLLDGIQVPQKTLLPYNVVIKESTKSSDL